MSTQSINAEEPRTGPPRRSRNHPTLVLCYHAISETWDAPLSVTPRHFERQIATLARLRFRGVNFDDAATGAAGRRTVAITFDDAYRSVLELAAPILTRYGMPATVFVPTSFPDRGEPMSWSGIDHWIGGEHEHELLPLSWDELRELHARGWEIGSHTVTHPHLTTIDDDRLKAELHDSQQACEAAIGGPCRTLAYPYGDHDERVIAATREAGYTGGAALPSPLTAASDPYMYPRIGVYHRDHRGRFAMKISPLVRYLRIATGARKRKLS